MDSVDTLLDELDSTREQLLVGLAELPDEALLHPNAIGKFSIADVLANLVAWEAELVTGLLKIDQGKKPTALLAAINNRKKYNERRYKENMGRDLDRIFDDLQQVRVQLESWLERLSEKQLMDKKRYKWLNGRSLANLIADVTYKNEARYVPLIEAYANNVLES